MLLSRLSFSGAEGIVGITIGVLVVVLLLFIVGVLILVFIYIVWRVGRFIYNNTLSDLPVWLASYPPVRVLHRAPWG